METCQIRIGWTFYTFMFIYIYIYIATPISISISIYIYIYIYVYQPLSWGVPIQHVEITPREPHIQISQTRKWRLTSLFLCPAVLQLEGRDGNLIDLRDAAQFGVPMMPYQCGFPTKQAIPPTPVLQKVQ